MRGAFACCPATPPIIESNATIATVSADMIGLPSTIAAQIQTHFVFPAVRIDHGKARRRLCVCPGDVESEARRAQPEELSTSRRREKILGRAVDRRRRCVQRGCTESKHRVFEASQERL